MQQRNRTPLSQEVCMVRVWTMNEDQINTWETVDEFVWFNVYLQ
jgi:hypothetical protein